MKDNQKILLISIAILALLLSFLFLMKPDEKIVTSSLVQFSQTSENFSVVSGAQLLNFPADFGPHEEYQTEWWYYTGNLEDETGRDFGYQLTFFRRALLPEGEKKGKISEWAADQVYLAHFALSDIQENDFFYSEKIQRGAAGLAGSQVDEERFSVWLENWQVKQVETNVFQLEAEQNGISLFLNLVDLKGITFQGKDGFSPKGEQLGNASTYFSQTRLQTSGEICIDDYVIPVSGLSWMDHEFSTSALGADLVGWDWYSLQLSDGTELMLFTIRDAEGNISSFSSGNYILANGENLFLNRTDFEIEVKNTWESKNSGAEYPSGWRINIPELGLVLEIEPYLKDQELLVSFTYWEGAVNISGEVAGDQVSGKGYVELTGYAQSMQGQF